MSRYPLAEVLEGRSEAVQDTGRWLVPNPRLTGNALKIAEVFEACAWQLLASVTQDSAQLVKALDALLEGKDAAVRAALLEHPDRDHVFNRDTRTGHFAPAGSDETDPEHVGREHR